MDTMQTITGVFDFFKPDIDIQKLNDASNYKELQADSLELQIEEEINLMRESFLERVGTFQSQGARRGFKVGEGSTQQNIEMSAGNMAEDIQTAKKNVEYKAKQLRSSANMTRSKLGGLAVLGYGEKYLKNFGSQKEKIT